MDSGLDGADESVVSGRNLWSTCSRNVLYESTRETVITVKISTNHTS